MQIGYLGNPNLKKVSTPIEWTPELLAEYKKCADDPIYFAEKYIKVVHVDRGLIPIELYDYQKEIILAITHNRRVVCNTSRQAGKCVSANTPIRIRNKKTGEILKTTIGEFYGKFESAASSSEKLVTRAKQKK